MPRSESRRPKRLAILASWLASVALNMFSMAVGGHRAIGSRVILPVQRLRAR